MTGSDVFKESLSCVENRQEMPRKKPQGTGPEMGQVRAEAVRGVWDRAGGEWKDVMMAYMDIE